MTPSFDLNGKTAFIAGVADDQGFGWAIAKALADCGAKVIVGCWAPVMRGFVSSLERGKFDQSRQLNNGKLLEIAKVYPMGANFDTMDDVPEEVRNNRLYSAYGNYAVADVAQSRTLMIRQPQR